MNHIIAELRMQLEERAAALAAAEALIASSDHHLHELEAHQAQERASLTKQIEELTHELDRLVEERDSSIKQIAMIAELNTKLSQELASMPELERSREQADVEINRLQGEINHLNQKAESQARDLKKALKESAVIISEFEKALIRKSEECNVSSSLLCLHIEVVFYDEPVVGAAQHGLGARSADDENDTRSSRPRSRIDRIVIIEAYNGDGSYD
jgi:chromosome segregation ATPase